MWWFPAIGVLLALSCSASGPQPGATYFWNITSSAVSFGACSDAPDFRASTGALEIEPNSFIIYRVSEDGTRAVTQDCAALDAATCRDAAAPLEFSVAGDELTAVEEYKNGVQGSACSLVQTQTWTLVDGGRTMALDIASVLSLADSEADCAAVEAELKGRSPNRTGILGCVVTYTLEGELR